MICLDHRKPERIEAVIRWCHADKGDGKRWQGWQNNILSTEKLRQRFDQLELAMEQGASKHGSEETQHGRGYRGIESTVGTTIEV